MSVDYIKRVHKMEMERRLARIAARRQGIKSVKNETENSHGDDIVAEEETTDADTDTTASRNSNLFQPGQSGNPKGRPKQPKTVNEVRALARRHTTGAIETLVRIHKNPKAPFAARTAAAAELLSRGWGKPAGDIEGVEGLTIKVIKFSEQPDDMRVIEATPLAIEDKSEPDNG